MFPHQNIRHTILCLCWEFCGSFTVHLRGNRMYFSILEDQALHELCFCWELIQRHSSLFHLFFLSSIKESFVKYWKDSFSLLFVFLRGMCLVFVYVVCVVWCKHVNVQRVHLYFPSRGQNKLLGAFPYHCPFSILFSWDKVSQSYKLVFLTRLTACLLFQ